MIGQLKQSGASGHAALTIVVLSVMIALNLPVGMAVLNSGRIANTITAIVKIVKL